MTTPPHTEVPIRSDAELTERWSVVLDPPVFGARSLWLMWIDHEGLMLPVLLPVEDLPSVPDRGMLEGLRRLHVGVAQQRLPLGGRLAIALCRPGLPTITKDDEAWAKRLREALDGVPVAPYPTVHLAAGGTVVPIDDPW